MSVYSNNIKRELRLVLENQDLITDQDSYFDLIKKAIMAIDDLEEKMLGEYSRGRADGLVEMAEILSGREIR